MNTLLQTPEQILQSLPVLWTFVLLLVRYGALLTLLPGIGLGEKGVFIRIPAAMAMAAATVTTSPVALVPSHWAQIVGAIVTEMFFGAAIGLIPLLVIAGFQTAASIASTTMGLSGSSLIDPTTNTSVPELGRIYGDLAVLLFLSFGGHYMAIYAASAIGGTFAPGSFFSGQATVEILLRNSGEIFRIGAMVSAPIVVALLLTQFVMGLISKAVPTVNVFIISFPLTIGIGLILSVLILPEMVAFMRREMRVIENSILVVQEDRNDSSKEGI